MLVFHVIVLICALICFGAAAANLYPKVNLLALGLALFTLVPLSQVLARWL